MFIVTRTKTIAVENEDGELEAVTTVDDVHVETDASDIIQRIKLGDDRVRGVRVFHMGVDNRGTPAIGTEATE